MVNKRVKKTKEKVEKVEKRDKHGRFKKGTGGGPGRKKGEPSDVISKGGKKRSTEQLIEDLLSTYTKLGSDKFLHSWAVRSQKNLSRFLDILFKFAPLPKSIDSSDPRSPLYQVSEHFMPKLTIERIITDQNPDDHGGPKMKMPRPGGIIDKKMKDLEDKLRQRDAEIGRFKSIFKSHGIDADELKHEPIRAIELPECSESEIDKKIEDAEKRKEELEAKLKEKGK